MLKVSPQKGAIRFGKRGKLNPRYIGPFKNLKRVGPVAYTLEIPEELSNVHSTFHVYNLNKCLSDESLVILMKELRLDDKLYFVEEPIEIKDREVKQLRQSRIHIVKMIVFTKLITHHLQSKHKFYPRPDSLVHLPYEEYVLGYLKFSAKGTKRKVFGMPIPNNLITADIQGEQYYNAYLEKVAKHQRYLVGEEVSDPYSPVPKPAKATKPKATKQSKPLAPKAAPVTKPATAKALKPTASQPPKPTPATTKPSKKDQSKKRKLVKESSEAPSPAKRPKASKVIKKRTQKSSLQLVDKFVDECVPVNEPRFGDEEADMKKVVEESTGKGKEKVNEEQAAQVLLNLHTPKKKSPADQFIFQRRTPVPTKLLGHEESSSLYAELGLTDSETESNDDVSSKINPEAQDKGQAGPNPGSLSFLQHLTKDFSFGDQFFNDKPSEVENDKTIAETDVESMVSVTIHQDTSAIPLMTSLVIDLISRPDSPNEHRPLPAIATTTETTTKSITTLPLPPQPQQSTTDSILIKRIGELEQHMVDLIQYNLALEERMDKHGSRLYKLENLDIPHQVSKVVDEIVTDAIDWAIQAPLRDRFRDLLEADMYEALEKLMDHDHSDQLLTVLAEARRKKKKRHDSPKAPPGSPPHQPPPPLPLAGLFGTLGAFRTSRSSQLPHPPAPLSTN
ncbi:hypothetical protein Tco_0667925 [Tanacetum coccineum]